MVEQKVKITNETGLHARASAQFISFVYKYKSDISIISGTRTANAKSILNLIMLSLNCGDEVIVRANGQDEEKALSEIIAYIENMRD